MRSAVSNVREQSDNSHSITNGTIIGVGAGTTVPSRQRRHRLKLQGLTNK